MKGITDFKTYRTRIAYDTATGDFVQISEALADFADEPAEGGKPPCASQLPRKGEPS